MRVHFVPFLRLALAALLGLAFVRPGLGQRFSETDLDKESKRTLRLRSKLFRGEEPFNPGSKDHQEAIGVAAKLVTYPYDFPDTQRSPKGMHEVFDRLE